MKSKKTKPTKSSSKPNPKNDEAFEHLLVTQFEALRKEIDAFIARTQKNRKVSGKELPFKTDKQGRNMPWKAGIAALLLIGVSTPLLIQLNKDREEAKVTQASEKIEHSEKTPLNQENPSATKSEVTAQTKKSVRAKARKRARASAASEAAARKNPPAQKSLDVAASKKEEQNGIEPRARSPFPEPAAAPKDIPASEKVAEGSSQSSPRSLEFKDAATKFKRRKSAAEERTEMEGLWKEFEKNPKAFFQNKKRSARLEQLLKEYDKGKTGRIKKFRTQKQNS